MKIRRNTILWLIIFVFIINLEQVIDILISKGITLLTVST